MVNKKYMKEEERLLLYHMLQLKSLVNRGKASRGICFYASRYSKQLFPYFTTWVHFSGSTTWPIRSTDKHLTDSSMWTYASGYNRLMWEGDYGTLRKDLLDHVIKELLAKTRIQPKYDVRYWLFRIQRSLAWTS